MAAITREEACVRILRVDFDAAASAFAEKFAFEGYDPIATYTKMATIEPAASTLAQDVSYILTFVAVRGTKASKATKRMSREGQVKLQEMIAKYDIKEGASQAAADVISFGRIASAFPHIMLKICAAGLNREVVQEDALPRSLRFMQAPSLFANDHYKVSWLSWAKRVDAVINPKKPDPEKVERFYEIMKNGNFLSTDQRMRILTENGIAS